MQVSGDAWDPYRLFCLSAASPPCSQDETAHVTAVVNEEEVQNRLGVVEEYLAEWNRLLRSLARSTAQACYREQQHFFADETEERRFIEDDIAYLPYKLFAEYLWNSAQQLLMTTEEEGRQEIFQQFIESFVKEVFARYEALQRMRVTCEALDSLAIKACHVGRFGLREGRLARTSAPGHTYEPSASELTSRPYTAGSTISDRNATASLVVELEEAERHLIDAARHDFMVEAAVVHLGTTQRLVPQMTEATATVSTQ